MHWEPDVRHSGRPQHAFAAENVGDTDRNEETAGWGGASTAQVRFSTGNERGKGTRFRPGQVEFD